MKLITREIADKIPRLYAQDGKGDEATVFVKFFTPDSNWTWFATEADLVLIDEDGNEVRKPLAEYEPEGVIGTNWDVEFFGLVDGLEQELGYFVLSELVSVKGPAGLRIERDRHFGPKTIKECRR